MVSVEVKGIIKEIIFQGDKSCIFLIDNNDGQIIGTITKDSMRMLGKIQIGIEYEFLGYITTYINHKKHISNQFYVVEIN